MCGINVIKRFDKSPAKVEDISRMCSAIFHRGPDGAGYAHVDSKSGLLGHVRLSIIDLAGGAQPLYNEDGSVCITFNGEIYDYKNLRDDLIQQGHVFKTHSDTEVIIHLYEQYGMDFLSKLNGEFAFVIWDANLKRLIAARDRMGVKPLYYFYDSNEIVMSSEVKGILALDRIPREFSSDYLVGSLFGCFPKGSSVVSKIRSLKPGHFMIVEDSGPQEERPYWTPRFQTDEKMSFEDARLEVKNLFTNAVKRRMVADVPVGSYLSGGLDSTLVCALMASETKNFKAFNIGFGGSIYDESNLARKIAHHYGAQFETIDCSNEAMAQNYLKTIYHVEMPLVNPSAVAKQMLSGLVRSQNYKVCITGEGSDEVFGGYPYFRQEKLWRMMLGSDSERAEGAELWKKFEKAERKHEGALWIRTDDWKSGDHPLGYPNFHRIRAVESSKKVAKVLSEKVLSKAKFSTPLGFFDRDFQANFLKGFEPFNATKVITFNQLSSYIIPTLGDRVEMANSVECRTPFLDKDLVDFAGTVPTEHFMNIRILREKYLIRSAFKDILPAFLENEHKKPFFAPNWRTFSKTKSGKEIFNSYLNSSLVKECGFFNKSLIPILKAYWTVLPEGSSMWKKIDILMGMAVGVHAVHEQFIKNKIFVNHPIQLVNYTWKGAPTLERPRPRNELSVEF